MHGEPVQFGGRAGVGLRDSHLAFASPPITDPHAKPGVGTPAGLQTDSTATPWYPATQDVKHGVFEVIPAAHVVERVGLLDQVGVLHFCAKQRMELLAASNTPLARQVRFLAVALPPSQ